MRPRSTRTPPPRSSRQPQPAPAPAPTAAPVYRFCIVELPTRPNTCGIVLERTVDLEAAYKAQARYVALGRKVNIHELLPNGRLGPWVGPGWTRAAHKADGPAAQ